VAIVFWTLVGIAVGLGVGAALPLSDTALLVAGGIGAVAGLCVGVYALASPSKLARILELPGAILGMFLDQLP
jgi:hypothetical protein